MTGFIAGAALLLALTFLVLLSPYWRKARHAAAAANRRQLNAAIYRDQMAELDRDLATGALSEDDHRLAREELQRRLLEDSAADETVPAAPTRPKRTLLALAALLPLAAAGLYLLLGNPAALNPPPPERQFTQADIERMVNTLAARLEQQPDNLEGWVMLARSYRVMRRFADAEKAFAKAGSLVDGDAALLSEYADVIVARTGNFDGKPMELIGRALKLDPDNIQARWLAGTAYFERGRYAQAVAEWEHAQGALPPGSEDAQALAASIEEARMKGGLKAPAKSADGKGAAAKGVAGRVVLDPALQAKVSPNDTVMVVARVANGPRMPVAVLRTSVAALPLDFVLDDSLAMTPDMRISLAQQVTVEARVSKSGQAMLQKGDIQSAPQTVKVGSGNIKLVLDQLHP